MNKIINMILNVLKFILLFISFGLSFYIIMYMYQRLEKGFLDTLEIFIPYILLFILMAVNHIFEQKSVTSNLFYNFTCCLVFVTFIFAGYRAITDEFMIMKHKMGYDINFNYFADIVAPLKSMLYLLIASNILLIFTSEGKKKIMGSDVNVNDEVKVIEAKDKDLNNGVATNNNLNSKKKKSSGKK